MMHQVFPGFSKMDAKYMMLCLLPMLSGNNYVFADKNGDGICVYKATYVRLFINPLYASFQVMLLSTGADRKSKGKFWIHRLSFRPPAIDRLDDLTKLNLGKCSCNLFYHIYTPISVDSTHWIIFYVTYIFELVFTLCHKCNKYNCLP